MKKEAYINYPVYFNRLWVPEFDEDGNLIVPKGLEEFIDVTKQFEQRERKKMNEDDEEEEKKEKDEAIKNRGEEDLNPKYRSEVNQNNYFRQSSLIEYVAKRLENAKKQ